MKSGGRNTGRTMQLLMLGVRGGRRLTGFAINTILLAAASLLLMPATIGAAGLEIWSSIVLAQSLGLVVATIVSYGYMVNGPAIVATRTPEEGVDYYQVAQRTRFIIAIPSFACMVGAMFVIPNPDPVAGLLGGANLAIGAFSSKFFYVGRGAPLGLLLTEIGPRVTLMIAGAITLFMGAPLLIGLALPAVGAVVGIVTSYLSIRMSAMRTSSHRQRNNGAGVRAEFRRQLGPATASVLNGGREALPVLVVTAVAAGLVGAYGVFDRAGRQASNALAPMTSTLQGWVPRRVANSNSARPAVAAMLVGFVAATAILVLFTLLGSPLIRWLAAGQLAPTFNEIFLFSAAIAINMQIQVINFACIVPLRGAIGVFWSNLAGVVAIPAALVVMLSLEQSVSYALGAIVIGYFVQLVIQLLLVADSIVRRQ